MTIDQETLDKLNELKKRLETFEEEARQERIRKRFEEDEDRMNSVKWTTYD